MVVLHGSALDVYHIVVLPIYPPLSTLTVSMASGDGSLISCVTCCS